MKIISLLNLKNKMNFQKELSKAYRWMTFACDHTWFVPEHLYGTTQTVDPDLVEIKFSKRMTVEIGRAHFDNGKYSIKLSSLLWPRASEAVRRKIVIHEACHLIDYCKNGIMNHGNGWKNLMRLCGEVPDIYHRVDNTGLTRT